MDRRRFLAGTAAATLSTTIGKSIRAEGQNGIALRGVGFALSSGYLHSRQLAWAQANVAAAWIVRNSNDVMWNNWTPDTLSAVTPSSGLYSWDCSSALAGMFDIPAPGENGCRRTIWGDFRCDQDRFHGSSMGNR